MLFGDRNSFAVEISLNENYGGEWLFGKICYWIKGNRFGKYEEGTSLRDALGFMKWVIHDAGNRSGEDLCHLPDSEAFQIIDNSLYGEDPPNPLLPETPARFEVAIQADVLIEMKLYLFQCGEKEKLLYKSIYESKIKSVFLEDGFFDSVINQVYDYLYKLHELETFRNQQVSEEQSCQKSL